LRKPTYPVSLMAARRSFSPITAHSAFSYYE
jgi:hypothetical protein